MKKLLFMVILLLDTTGLIIAQNSGKIKGKITDAQTGEDIPFANVLLFQNTQQVKGVTSDFNGDYIISNLSAGLYDLKVTYVGYQTLDFKKIQVKTDSSIVMINAKLKQAAELSEVQIIQYKKPLIDMEQSSGATITKEEIRRMPASEIQSVHVSDFKRRDKYSNKVQHQPEVDPYSNESYDKINHNEFQKVMNAPLSTFSIDVDAASYSNVRRFINMGSLPPKDAVRTEEMINYFNYDYPDPDNETPFSVITELGQCPWNTKNKLVHIGIQGKKVEVDNLPPNNLVFLIDVSGSMAVENKLPLVQKSLRLLVNQMRREDHIAMVVYAGAAGLVLPSTSGNRKEEILSAIDRLSAGGSTNGAGGIILAYNVAKENFIRNGNNRVVLATDGDFNVGVSSDADLVSMIEGKRNDGIYLTVLGYGMGNYKDSKMEKLADKGNGNYAYIDNLQEANKVLVKEMGGTLFTIAKDVKIQVEFNPEKVKSYRLVGYENRLLADKDFNDDTKDAGELGAGHTVTALYEIVSADGEEDENPEVDPLKYQKKIKVEPKVEPGVHSDELMTIKLRYKEPKESKSKLITKVLKDAINDADKTSDNFRFSAAVAQFGMLLTDSKYKSKATYESTLSLARNSRGKDEDGYRAEFVRMLELVTQLSINK